MVPPVRVISTRIESLSRLPEVVRLQAMRDGVDLAERKYRPAVAYISKQIPRELIKKAKEEAPEESEVSCTKSRLQVLRIQAAKNWKPDENKSAALLREGMALVKPLKECQPASNKPKDWKPELRKDRAYSLLRLMYQDVPAAEVLQELDGVFQRLKEHYESRSSKQAVIATPALAEAGVEQPRRRA